MNLQRIHAPQPFPILSFTSTRPSSYPCHHHTTTISLDSATELCGSIDLPSPLKVEIWLSYPQFPLRLEPNLIPALVWQRLSDLLHAVHFELQADNLALIEVQQVKLDWWADKCLTRNIVMILKIPSLFLPVSAWQPPDPSASGRDLVLRTPSLPPRLASRARSVVRVLQVAQLLFTSLSDCSDYVRRRKAQCVRENIAHAPGSWTVARMAAMSSNSFLACSTFRVASLLLICAWLALDRAWEGKCFLSKCLVIFLSPEYLHL